MRHSSTTISKRSTGLLAFIAALPLGAGIAACDRAPQVAPEAKLSAATQPAAKPPPVPVPAVTEGAHSAQTATANEPPMKSMSKEEESASMPLPGQANDHSTLAKDSKK
jgi:hypothetical protein